MRTQADRDDDLAIGRQLERKDAEIERLRAALYKIAQGGNRVRMDWPASPVLDRESMCDIAADAITQQERKDT